MANVSMLTHYSKLMNMINVSMPLLYIKTMTHIHVSMLTHYTEKVNMAGTSHHANNIKEDNEHNNCYLTHYYSVTHYSEIS